jgi:hypothetical protein
MSTPFICRAATTQDAAASPSVAANAAAVAAVLTLTMAGAGGGSDSIYFTSWRCSTSPAISGKATA